MHPKIRSKRRPFQDLQNYKFLGYFSAGFPLRLCWLTIDFYSKLLFNKERNVLVRISIKKIGPQYVHVWLTKLSCFDGEGHKLKGSGLLLSFY